MLPEPDDAEITGWALAAKAGDRAAAAAFIRATQQAVIRFLAHLADPGDAEDLAQETYLRAMRALPRFAARSSARTWLLAIARRVAADHIRTLVRRPRLASGQDWEVVAEQAGAQSPLEDGVILRQLLLDLPVERREAFVATQIAGLSYAEAAEVCGCPVGTIRSRVARAREDLVAALEARRGRRAQSAG
jgi:RNA polymerase sigma-70 factor (ECF subfamily)